MIAVPLLLSPLLSIRFATRPLSPRELDNCDASLGTASANAGAVNVSVCACKYVCLCASLC